MKNRMLSVDLMMEMARRLQQDKGWWKPDTAAGARHAASEAGYCIDAPDEIPAGSVAWEDVDEDLGGPFPTMVFREADNT